MNQPDKIDVFRNQPNRMFAWQCHKCHHLIDDSVPYVRCTLENTDKLHGDEMDLITEVRYHFECARERDIMERDEWRE